MHLALLASSGLTQLDLLLITIAALGAGIANAMAGGGTFITFPTLTAVGLSPTVANITNTATAMTTVALQPKNLWRVLMVYFPISLSDCPIHIKAAMMGTEITPLTMALQTRALMGSSSK